MHLTLRSDIVAKATADGPWCYQGPGYSYLSILPSLTCWLLSSCFVVTKWPRKFKASCPSSRQKAGGTSQGLKVFCLFFLFSPNEDLLCSLGGTHSPETPTNTVYAITMFSGHIYLQENLWKYFQLSTLSPWTKKSGILVEKKNWEWILNKQVAL